MKSFRQTIQESSVNDKLDKLAHTKPLSNTRLKQLTRNFSMFEDIDLDRWQGYPPPKNSSQVTKNEILHLVSLSQFRDQSEKDMVMHDKKIITAFREYLDKHELEVDLEKVDDLLKQSNPILLSLKRFYKRPRPYTLAKKLGLELSFFPLKTAETPSYPSGHAAQGRLAAKLIADEVPFEHRRNLLDIGERIGHTRQIAGAHFASDTEFGHRLGDEMYRLATTSREPDLKLEDILKEEKIEISVASFLPPASKATRRTVIYEGAALVGFFGKSIMSENEWRNGGAKSFKMKDWYEGHYLKKDLSGDDELKVRKDAWLVFCDELGSTKFDLPPKDFIWARIGEYYKSAPSTWETRAFKDNTADAIVITKGTADGLFKVMKKVKAMTDEEQIEITKADDNNMITCDGVSFYQVSLKKGMGDSRIGKTAPFVVDRGSDYHGLKKGIHKPKDVFHYSDLEFNSVDIEGEEFIKEALTEGWFSGVIAKVKDKVSNFVSKAKKFLSKIRSKLFSKATKLVNTFIKKDKTVKAATKIVEGLKASGAVISEGVLTERTLKLNQATIDGINEFQTAFMNGTPIKKELTKMKNAVDALNKKKDPDRVVDPILMTGTTKLKAITPTELKSLKELDDLEVGDHIALGENTPFNTVLKLTSNMIGFVYINGLLDSISKDAFEKFKKVEQGLSNAIIGMSVDIEGEAKFGNTALPIVICYGGQTSPTKLGKRDEFETDKKEKLTTTNKDYNDYPVLVIRINKLEPHNSVNLYLINSVDIVNDKLQGDHADPSWMNVSISTSSGSKFATKVESNTITKTYEK